MYTYVILGIVGGQCGGGFKRCKADGKPGFGDLIPFPELRPFAR